MRIGFWQNCKGHGCTTATMTALALQIVTNVNSNLKVALMQTHYGDENNLFPSLTQENENSTSLIGGSLTGIDQFISCVSSGKTSAKDLRNATMSYVNGKLDLIYKTRVTNRSLYQNNFNKYAGQLFTALDSVFELTFIDIEAGSWRESEIALNNCQFIVYCIPQELTKIESLLGMGIDLDKSVFIIGDYDHTSALNYTNLIKRFPEFNKTNLFYIPHCTAYADAINNKSLIRFFTNMQPAEPVKKLNPNDEIEYFFACVNLVNNALLNLILK